MTGLAPDRRAAAALACHRAIYNAHCLLEACEESCRGMRGGRSELAIADAIQRVERERRSLHAHHAAGDNAAETDAQLARVIAKLGLIHRRWRSRSRTPVVLLTGLIVLVVAFALLR